MKTFEEVRRVVDVLSSSDIDYHAYATDDEVCVVLNCNDYFWWGTADAERVTYEDIPLLLDCIKELYDLDKYAFYASDLFLCRKRNLRPQDGIFYNFELWRQELIAKYCPKRENDIANPPHPNKPEWTID
jgi:hypothetical protein